MANILLHAKTQILSMHKNSVLRYVVDRQDNHLSGSVLTPIRGKLGCSILLAPSKYVPSPPAENTTSAPFSDSIEKFVRLTTFVLIPVMERRKRMTKCSKGRAAMFLSLTKSYMGQKSFLVTLSWR